MSSKKSKPVASKSTSSSSSSSSAVSWKPKDYQTVNPYIIIRGCKEAIKFYVKALGAKERGVMLSPDGSKVAHGEIQVGDSVIMMGDEAEEHKALSAHHYGGSPVAFCVYVPDVDKSYNHAIKSGCQSVRPPADQFYGDRSGAVKCPYGYSWHFMTRIKDMTFDEIKEAGKKLHQAKPEEKSEKGGSAKKRKADATPAKEADGAGDQPAKKAKKAPSKKGKEKPKAKAKAASKKK